MRETIETRGDYRAVLVLDESPEAPDSDGQGYIIRVTLDDGAAMTVWTYDPREVRDPYPNIMIEIGPRGGIRRSHC